MRQQGAAVKVGQRIYNGTTWSRQDEIYDDDRRIGIIKLSRDDRQGRTISNHTRVQTRPGHQLVHPPIDNNPTMKGQNMISVQRKADGSFEITSGILRLKALLEVYGKAEVVEISTGNTIHVHEVDGKLMALSEDGQANLEDLACFAINKAKR